MPIAFVSKTKAVGLFDIRLFQVHLQAIHNIRC